MRNLFVLFFVLIVFCFCSLNNIFLTNIISKENNYSIEFVCNKKNNIEGATEIKNGESYIYQTDSSMAKVVYERIKGCVGFTIIFFKSSIENIVNYFDNFQLLENNNFKDKNVIYGYTSNLSFCTFVDNNKINVQIVEEDDKLILGSPLILTSY